MLLERFVNGRVRSNAYVYAATYPKTVIVDAGHGAAAKIIDLVDAEGLEPQAIVLTHGHPDHIWTARQLTDRYEIPAYIHPMDRGWFDDPATGGHVPLLRVAGRVYGRPRRLRPRHLEFISGEEIDIGTQRLQALHTPGHSRGSTCFVVDGLCFAGDTIFFGGLGHTSYPGGSRRLMRESVRSKLLRLDDDVRVLPGHGRETAVGAERGLWEAFIREKSRR